MRFSRREFLDKCAIGFTVAAGSLASLKATHAAGDTTSSKIDADRLAETACKHFIPGKRTCCESILMAGCEALEIKSEQLMPLGMAQIMEMLVSSISEISRLLTVPRNQVFG